MAEDLFDEDLVEIGDQNEQFDAETGRIFDRENPIDDGGTGFNDEKGEVPGEQAGAELNIHAGNRPRNSDGKFI